MFGARSVIASIAETRERVESLGATLADEYSFLDIIFVPQRGAWNLNRRTIRLRVHGGVGSQLVASARLTDKRIRWAKAGKSDEVILNSSFGDLEKAFVFIQRNYGNSLKIGLEYSRDGWKYKLGDCHLYIEDIKIPWFPSTIEIEAETEEGLRECCERLGISEISFYSVPEMVRRHLRSVSNKPKA